jgi:hypothetical protein
MVLTRNWRRLALLALLLALLLLLLVGAAAYHALHPIVGHHIQALADSPDVIVHNH